jgi:glyoxylase-like metal-dependent hydrolase (beta-lactamase superfamily II)
MAELSKISEHVWWLPPGPPDRPSLCAVVGARRTVMLDAGSSSAHARMFLDALKLTGTAAPSAVVYTHAHWDHVFGGAELGATVVAQSLTAHALAELAGRDWSDAALDERVAAGLASPAHAAQVKEELPSPREVHVAPADIVFAARLDFELGGATLRVRHVGGDHSPDSTVMLVEPDGVLFLGDCLSASSAGALHGETALPLYDTLLGFDATIYVEGHSPSVSSRAELEELVGAARLAERVARTGSPPAASNADAAFFFEAFRLGLEPST